MTACRRPMILLVAILLSTMVKANPDVISREYKMMLDASQFTYQNEAVSVGQLLALAETKLESDIGATSTEPFKVVFQPLHQGSEFSEPERDKGTR